MKFRALTLIIALSVAGLSPVLARAGTFTFRMSAEPETLDWNRAHTSIETYILMNLMEGLVGYDSNLKPVPSLAESWTVSSDGKIYTFKLRRRVNWSDGVPLKAQDFVYSWKRLLSPLTAASYAYLLFDVVGAKNFYDGKNQDFDQVAIKALDDATLEVRLVKPVAHWIDIPTFWATFPLRKDIVEKPGASWDTPGRMVTVGPYTLESHDIESKIVMKANPFYWGARGNVDRVVGLIVKDDSTAMSLYEAGKLDFLTDISTLDLKRLAGRSELKTFPYLKTGYIGFTLDKFPTSNVHLRRAIAMGIDKSKLGEILHGGQRAAASLVPPGMMAHSDRLGLPYDPARARSELELSGLDTREGQHQEVELLLPNWDKQMMLAQFVQEELKRNLGLEVVLQPFDHKTFRAQLDLHVFPLFEGSWAADYPDPDNFLSIFLSDSGNNRSGWKDPEYDSWVVSARTQPSTPSGLKARESLYEKAQKRLLEESVVLLPLYYEPNMALVRSRVKGLELNPLNYLLLRKVMLGP